MLDEHRFLEIAGNLRLFFPNLFFELHQAVHGMVGDKILLPFVFVVEKHLFSNLSFLLGRKRRFVIGQADRLDFFRVLREIVAVCVHGQPRGMIFHDHQDEGAVHGGL